MFDELGSERTVTNSSQTVTGTLNLDSFGNQVGSTGSSGDPYMFAATSRYRNDGDAGLTLVGARYYDGQVGRFVSRDTVLTEKPYLYCNHDPVNKLDPSGHEAEWYDWVIAIGGAAVGVGVVIVGGVPVLVGIGVITAEGGSLGVVIGGASTAVGGLLGGIGSVGWIQAHMPKYGPAPEPVGVDPWYGHAPGSTQHSSGGNLID